MDIEKVIEPEEIIEYLLEVDKDDFLDTGVLHAATNAIKIQIRKKPSKTKDYHLCPNCNKPICFAGSLYAWQQLGRYHFCDRCGQKFELEVLR